MKKIITIAILAMTLSGCGSLVTDSTIKSNTAFTLGLQQDDFTVKNRQNGLLDAKYEVDTKSGKQYRCYVTSSFGIVVSDALCSQLGGDGGYVNNGNNELLNRANNK